MVTRMKTTLDLPDELFRELKELARSQGATMREVIVEGLRAELDRRTRQEPRVDFAFPTFKGTGLRPDVRNEDIVETSYGDRL